MSSIDWDCWIGDESGGNKVYLIDEEQPNPIPLPEAPWQGTLHDLISPGASALQSAGYGPETLTVNIRVTLAQWLLIKALLTRVTSGVHMQVQFNNSYHTYLCTSIGQLKPEYPNKRPPKVSVSLQLLIESTVT